MKKAGKILVLGLVVGMMLMSVSFRVMAADPDPMWIWYPEESGNPAQDAPSEDRYFVKTVDIANVPEYARIEISVDNSCTLYVNGEKVKDGICWTPPLSCNILSKLKKGKNIIAIQAGNAGGPAGLLVKAVIRTEDQKQIVVVSNENWLVSDQEVKGWLTGKTDSSFVKPTELGDINCEPWNSVGGVHGKLLKSEEE